MFADHYIELIEKDLVVIPLNGKIPVIKNWSQFAKTRPSELLVDAWTRKYPKNNIGLVTGKLSGYIAIDIDKDEAKKLVPNSPLVKKGKKGETRFFKYDGEVNFKRHDLGIELLSDGNQTVIPPSIHPETREAYIWTSQHDLTSIDRDDVPTISEVDPDFFKNVGGIPLENVSSGGRHMKLIEIVSAMLSRGEKIDDVVEEIIKYDVENHSPPYFTDEKETHKGAGFAAALSMVGSIAKTITQRGGDVRPKNIEIVIGENEVQKLIEENEKKVKLKEVKFPEPPGVLKDISEYIMKISHKPREKFAVASALGLVGTILSNKIKFRSATPNLYQLLIAESGEGKDVPLKGPKEILIKAGLFQYVGLESYRGDKSVVKKFETQRERIDTLDEVSKLFRSINSRSNTFQSNIAETLTELWNSGNKLYMGQTTAEGTTGMVFNPCLSIMGATTPNSFSETFSSSNLMQGFGGRFLYFFDDKRVKLRRIKDESVPEGVLRFVELWGKKKIEIEKVDISKTATFNVDLSKRNPEITHLKNIEKPIPFDLPIEEEAEKILDDAAQYFDEYQYHCEDVIRPIVHRALQQIEKIMLISAAATSSFDDPYPTIKVQDVRFAWNFVEACLMNTSLFFNVNLIQSKYQRDSQKVLKVLRASPKGLSKRELSFKLRNQFKSTELYDARSGIIPSLIEDGRVKQLQISGKTKPKIVFILDREFDQ